MLSILVPVVLLLSLIPNIGLPVSASTTATVTAAVGLGLMHVITVCIAIPVYRRFLPLGTRRRISSPGAVAHRE